MGYDYRQKLKAEGQQHSNACWAASISWWMSAMSLHYKRTTYTQTDLLADFQQNVVLGGGVRTDGIRKIVESAKVRMDLRYISPAKLKTDYNIGSPCLIIYNYPAAGGTHMNVIFDQQGDTVMCMEPFYPLQAAPDGSRKGAYVRRPLSFFANSQEIGIACLPLKESMNGTEESY
jgi:hypothetical protein